jgi:ribosome-binding factor A
MSKRIERVNELIKEQLSLLIHNEFAEELGIIVVNSVEAERDLKTADVYISGISNDKSELITKKLQSKAHEFQHYLGKKLDLRFVPKLTFIYDKYQRNIDKIEELLTNISKEE